MKSSEPARLASTYLAPSTCVRAFMPFSNNSSAAIVSPSIGPLSSRLFAHFHAREFLERLHELGDVGVWPLRGLADRHHLTHRIADDHRHAERFGFVETELDVLVKQRGGEPEVQAARHHPARHLVGGRGMAGGAGVDD